MSAKLVQPEPDPLGVAEAKGHRKGHLGEAFLFSQRLNLYSVVEAKGHRKKVMSVLSSGEPNLYRYGRSGLEEGHVGEPC